MMNIKISKILNTALQYLRTKRLSNEYLEWLRFANAGMISRGNIYAMNYAIERLPSNNPVFEIGSFCGLSTNIMNYFLQHHKKGNKIITTDKWIFENSEIGGKIGDSKVLFSDYREFVKASYMRNVEFFSSYNKPYTIEATSDEFFECYKSGAEAVDVFGRSIRLGGNFSFAYIDGNHTYDFTKRDFENVDRYLDIGGFILFDDSSDLDAYGLTKLMKEIRQNSKYKLVMKNPNYLFQKTA